jgi:hypothetical protein
MRIPKILYTHYLPHDLLGIDKAHRLELEKGTAEFIAKQISLAPAHFRLPIYVMGCVAIVWLCVLSLFMDRKKAQKKFDQIPIMPLRSFTRMIRSTALFYYAEHPLVRDKIGAANVVLTQEKKRQKRNDKQKQSAS